MLRVSHTSLHKMKVHAMRAFPEECCGMLLGQDGDGRRTIVDVIEMRNERRENRERRFLISPEEFQHAERLARNSGVEVVGFYHSHPDHPAQPSQFDLEHAMPWWSYIIVSVEGGLPTSVRSWVLRDDRLGYAEEAITMLEADIQHSHTYEEGGTTEWPSRS